MLGRDLELSRNVVANQLLEKRVTLVKHKIIEPDSRSYENFLDAGNFLNGSNELDIIAVIHLEIGAGLRCETTTVCASSELFLFIACRLSEIRGGTADVVDISFEILIFRQLASFGNYALDAS